MTRTVWYPGHMARGLRKLRELSEKLDLLVEVRDARAPALTGSPFSEQVARFRPVWIVLSKKDLAVEEATARWLSFFETRGKGLGPGSEEGEPGAPAQDGGPAQALSQGA